MPATLLLNLDVWASPLPQSQQPIQRDRLNSLLVPARWQFAREHIILQWVAGNRMLFRGPGAEVNQLAAFGAEWPARALRAPFDGGATGGAGD